MYVHTSRVHCACTASVHSAKKSSKESKKNAAKRQEDVSLFCQRTFKRKIRLKSRCFLDDSQSIMCTKGPTYCTSQRLTRIPAPRSQEVVEHTTRLALSTLPSVQGELPLGWNYVTNGSRLSIFAHIIELAVYDYRAELGLSINLSYPLQQMSRSSSFTFYLCCAAQTDKMSKIEEPISA